MWLQTIIWRDIFALGKDNSLSSLTKVGLASIKLLIVHVEQATDLKEATDMGLRVSFDLLTTATRVCR